MVRKRYDRKSFLEDETAAKGCRGQGSNLPPDEGKLNKETRIKTMKIELSFGELSKIESALREKIEKVDNIVNECDEPCMAKELLSYQQNLHELLSKIEAKLNGL